MGKKVYSADFKFKVALEALRGLKTINEIASDHSLHPNQVSQWKKQLREQGKEFFVTRRRRNGQDVEVLQSRLYEEIGRLKVELDWLKKKVL